MKKMVVALGILFSMQSHAAFSLSQNRYLEPTDYLFLLQATFAVDLADASPITLECAAINDKNRDFLGVNQEAAGEPITRSPNLNFAYWYGKCLREYLDADFNQLGVYSFRGKHFEILSRYFGLTYLEQTRSRMVTMTKQTSVTNEDVAVNTVKYLAANKWADLTVENRREYINLLALSFLGKSTAKIIDETLATITPQPDLTAFEAIHIAIYSICSRDEFIKE
jgi:hypothetical protein